VSTSSDQGQTWSTPVKINAGTTNSERVIFAFPAIASDGTVYVLWHDYNADEIYISKSTDGGVTWGSNVAVASTNIGFGTYIPCNGKTSKSYGRVVTPAPQMVIDPSGNIYVVFDSNYRNGGHTIDLDVYVTKSSDGGKSWSRPQRITSTSTGQQYFPTPSIDSLGRLNVAYLDRRDDPNGCRTNTYLSRSVDGAASFTDSKVTDVDSDFDGNANGPGDYQGQAAWGSISYPLFADHRDANATNDSAPGYIGGGFEIYSAIKP
jgi:Neuraminidase (sialidase)